METTGLEWIKENQQFLSIRGISIHLNKKTGFPLQGLAKELNGDQSLSKNWYKPLNKFVSALQEK